MELSLPCKEEYANILSTFLGGINFSMPMTTPDLSLEQPVISHFESQPWDAVLIRKATQKAKWASTGLGMVYPYVTNDAKVMYGIFSTYMFLIDDSDSELDVEFREFEKKLVRGEPQESPVLESLLKFLDDMGTCFGPYSRAMISKSMVEFVTGRVLENRYNGVMVPPVGALSFPQYLRQKAGIAEPYAHFAFPQHLYPEESYLEQYLPIIPDICDFSMTVHRISVSASLRLTCDKVVQSVNTIRTVLSHHPPMLDSTEQFMQAYVAWYINQARYKLADMDIRSLDAGEQIRGSTRGEELEGEELKNINSLLR
ncbi:isoprenoid synthase domain-containing protein [Bisporella sp. PMI_857]|nr:isoprenoid synthase domain-containing protein [Bisporella sp. PMI_857]